MDFYPSIFPVTEKIVEYNKKKAGKVAKLDSPAHPYPLTVTLGGGTVYGVTPEVYATIKAILERENKENNGLS